MAICPHCSKPLSSDFAYCPACGMRLAEFDHHLTSAATKPHPAMDAEPRPAGDPSGGEGRFVPGTILADRYRLVALVGRGGMGEVYRAEDLKLGQTVALKFLPRRLSSEGAALARFHREVRVARQISHPHVCRVFDIVETPNEHFITMEFVDGEDLVSLQRRIGRIPQAKALELARQLCSGLAVAHEQGIVHRDLKPANVMLDGRGKVRIMDFGLAGWSGHFSQEERSAGTPAYMAPEQFKGEDAGPKSDIYSLGLILFEIFTGRKPFEADSSAELLRRRSQGKPPRFLIEDAVDSSIERVVLACLAAEPRRRPESALKVAASLPGGDPLAAALAAGETPSPEMVAAAKEGALSPRLAAVVLTATVICFAVTVFFQDRFSLYRIVTLPKAPAVLAEQARGIIRESGHSLQITSWVHHFRYDLRFVMDAFGTILSAEHLDQIRRGRRSPIIYWYRQGERHLSPLIGFQAGLQDPPENWPGNASAMLDPSGHLLRLTAVPSGADSLPDAPPPDWSGLFAATAFDASDFMPVDPQGLPPFFADAVFAWRSVPSPEQPGIEIRAASFKGLPVYFEVLWEGNQPLHQGRTQASTRFTAFQFFGVALFVVVFAAALLLTRRHLKSGRGDSRGAFRLAVAVFSLDTAVALLAGDHVASLGWEASFLTRSFGSAFFKALFLWLLYMALEPYARRWWPHRLISWNRLLKGDFKDALIGRDTLVGLLAGFAVTALGDVRAYVVKGAETVLPPEPEPAWESMGSALASLVRESSGSISFGLAVFFLFVLIVAVTRREWIAATLSWAVLLFGIGLAFAFSIGAWAILGVEVAIVIFVMTRYGLLAIMFTHLFLRIGHAQPTTLDFSVWYFPQTLLYWLFVVAITAFAVRTALAGRPLLAFDEARPAPGRS